MIEWFARKFALNLHANANVNTVFFNFIPILLQGVSHDFSKIKLGGNFFHVMAITGLYQ